MAAVSRGLARAALVEDLRNCPLRLVGPGISPALRDAAVSDGIALSGWCPPSA
jgi:hypothetical protein